jgi:signal transduction histidine kinase
LRAELADPSPERDKNLAALDEMEATIGTFLAFARASGDREERSQVDIGALVESVCSDFSDGGADVTCVEQEGLVIGCRRLAVKRAVTNLIGNAVKYGHRARVSVRGADHQIVIRVDDDGPGIPEAEIEAVFQPFRRGDASRGPDSGGYGLGLSIAQAIAEDHGGRIRLANRPEGGLRAEMTLPV